MPELPPINQALLLWSSYNWGLFLGSSKTDWKVELKSKGQSHRGRLLGGAECQGVKEAHLCSLWQDGHLAQKSPQSHETHLSSLSLQFPVLTLLPSLHVTQIPQFDSVVKFLRSCHQQVSSQQYFGCPYNWDACVWGHGEQADPSSDTELGHGGQTRHRACLWLKSSTLLETEQGP